MECSRCHRKVHLIRPRWAGPGGWYGAICDPCIDELIALGKWDELGDHGTPRPRALVEEHEALGAGS